MANEEQLSILKQGVEVWNKWMDENPDIEIDLMKADLSETNLSGANLFRANLRGTILSYCALNAANFNESYLNGANFYRSDLSKAQLLYTQLSRAEFSESDLSGASLKGADLSEARFTVANLSGANLDRANLHRASLGGANLCGATLRESKLGEAHLVLANLSGAKLNEAELRYADLDRAYLVNADLSGADLHGANLINADLHGANLHGANLSEANLNEANLSNTDLSNANLVSASLVRTVVDKSKVSSSLVYAINVWDLEGEFEEQKDLVITPPPATIYKEDEYTGRVIRTTEPIRTPIITVDNIKIAQFVYLILNNEEIRDVINTLTSKSVLILGRFALPERKSILNALKDKLREYNLLPIVFDFERPTDKDFTEMIKTLAGLSYFVIADVTNPKSSPLELQATVPDYQIPFVPIIQEGESPFAMMVDLQKKYNWMLNTVTYDSADTLMKILKPLIIDPAMKKRQELRLIKAQIPEVISGKEFLEKGKE